MVITIIAWIVLGAIAGWIAGMLVKGDEGLGVIGHVVLGIIGAFVGGFLANLIGLSPGPAGGGDVINWYSIIVAIIGAVIVVLIANMVMGRGRRTV